MVGLPVAPASPSSSIRRLNRPESRSPRSMSSSQMLCPSASSSRNGLVISIPPFDLSYRDCKLPARSRLADALDLHLPVTHSDIVARRVDGGGTGEHAPIAHAETRAMPRALYNISCQPSLVKRPPGMGTRR